MKQLTYEQFIKDIIIVVDQQEKQIYHILNFFEKYEIKYIRKHLKAGDYTFIINDVPQKIIIERKNSLNELSSNLSKERDRFYREFEKVNKCKKYLLIENDNIDNLIAGTYGTDFKVNSYIANLLLLQSRFNMFIHFVNKYNFGLLLCKIFYYYYYRVLEQVQ